MNYGVPYKGGKNKIAEWVVAHLPAADTLVDLFAGGCGVTHCALLGGKFRRIIANDIADAPKLFLDAAQGKYKGESRWISRKDFFALKDSDPYVRYCWSFGNNGSSYIYSREIEPYKKALHICLYGATVEERRVAYRSVVDELTKYLQTKRAHGLMVVACLESLERLERLQNLESLRRLQNLGHLQQLQGLQHLERLQGLQSLPRLERLSISQKDYRDVEIPDEAVVYCDPPYIGTTGYSSRGFDHAAFYSWLNDVPHMCIVSEYTAPPHTVEVARKEKTCTYSASNNGRKTVERLFVQERFAERYHEMMGEQDTFKAVNE